MVFLGWGQDGFLLKLVVKYGFHGVGQRRLYTETSCQMLFSWGGGKKALH